MGHRSTKNDYVGQEMQGRVCAKPCHPTNSPPETWCDELQPEVLRLRAENERLRAEVEKWKDLVKTFSAGNVALEAEVERLRAALEGVLAEADRKTDEGLGFVGQPDRPA